MLGNETRDPDQTFVGRAVKYVEWKRKLNKELRSVTGGYTLRDFRGLIDDAQLEEMYERELDTSKAVDEIRREVARVFQLTFP